MSYPSQYTQLVRTTYLALIEEGIHPSLAKLVSEIMGRDAAGLPRSDRNQHHARECARLLVKEDAIAPLSQSK